MAWSFLSFFFLPGWPQAGVGSLILLGDSRFVPPMGAQSLVHDTIVVYLVTGTCTRYGPTRAKNTPYILLGPGFFVYRGETHGALVCYTCFCECMQLQL